MIEVVVLAGLWRDIYLEAILYVSASLEDLSTASEPQDGELHWSHPESIDGIISVAGYVVPYGSTAR